MYLTHARKIVDQLKRLPDEKFDMSHFVEHTKCGTTACLAGWICLLNGGPDDGDAPVGLYSNPVYKWAQRWLSLDDEEAQQLFLNNGTWLDHRGLEKDLEQVTRQEVIEELERRIREQEASEP